MSISSSRTKTTTAQRVFCVLGLSLLLALLCMPAATALIDLINPVQNIVTKSTTLSFDYYASVPGLTTCTLVVNGQLFPDVDVQNNAMNSVSIQNMTQGTYLWNIACLGSANETSQNRTFKIDNTPPTIAVITPQNNSNATSLSFDVIPNDESSTLLACAARWNGVIQDQQNIAVNTHYQKTLSVPAGQGVLNLTCADAANNTRTVLRTITLEPPLFLSLSTDKTTYGLGEQIILTVDSVPGADISVDICPNQPGFVQCRQAIIDNHAFPQTIILPYTNTTGEYLVDGIVQRNGVAITNQTTYTIDNTLSLTVEYASPQLFENMPVTLSAGGGIAPYSFTWSLSNGTTLTGVTQATLKYTNPGNYTERFTVTDSAGNTKQKNITMYIANVYNVTFYVIDKVTKLPIHLAGVTFAGIETQTIPDGTAPLTVVEGTHDLFVTAKGYDFVVDEIRVNGSRTYTYELAPRADSLQVEITSPTAGGTLVSGIDFTLSYATNAVCTLLIKTLDGWYIENETRSFGSGAHTFTTTFPQGENTVKIECKENGQQAISSAVTFTVSGAQEAATEVVEITSDDLYLQDVMAQVESDIAALGTYDQDAQYASGLLEFDKRLRNLKRAVQQAIRDLDSLQFRTDLDADAKTAERKNIVNAVQEQLENTPQKLISLDDKTYVKYPDEEELAAVAEELTRIGVLSDAKKLLKHLREDQQLFTMSTRLLHVEYTYRDGRKEVLTVVTRAFTYSDELEGYRIVEIIPKDVIDSAEKIIFLTPANILENDPILEFVPAESYTYILPRKIDFTKIETVATVLTRQYSVEEQNAITGFAIFTGEDVEFFGVPLFILLGLIVVGYLAYYFDLLTHLKYLVYKFGKHEQVHYLNVMINDVEDHLSANNYEKAELLYREIRMTYEGLSQLEKNELFDAIIQLVHVMDGYYFNMVLIEMDMYVKAGDMESAIASYEKLTGTFSRLSQEQQQQLVDRIVSMARRLGLEVHV